MSYPTNVRWLSHNSFRRKKKSKLEKWTWDIAWAGFIFLGTITLVWGVYHLTKSWDLMLLF